jgi:hypothetical protein
LKMKIIKKSNGIFILSGIGSENATILIPAYGKPWKFII